MNSQFQSAPNSAALGGAYRAKFCVMNEAGEAEMTFSEMVRPVAETASLVASPNKDAAMVYGPIIERVRKLETVVIDTFNSSSVKS